MRTPTKEELLDLIADQRSERHAATKIADWRRRGPREKAEDSRYWRREARKSAIIEGALRQWLARMEARS